MNGDLEYTASNVSRIAWTFARNLQQSDFRILLWAICKAIEIRRVLISEPTICNLSEMDRLTDGELRGLLRGSGKGTQISVLESSFVRLAWSSTPESMHALLKVVLSMDAYKILIDAQGDVIAHRYALIATLRPDYRSVLGASEQGRELLRAGQRSVPVKEGRRLEMIGLNCGVCMSKIETRQRMKNGSLGGAFVFVCPNCYREPSRPRTFPDVFAIVE